MSKPARYFAIAMLTMMGLCVIATADTLYLRAGEQELGTLKGLTPDAVVFQGREGEKSWPLADVNEVQLQQARRFDAVEKVDQITDADLKACLDKQPSDKDYPSDGAVVLLQRRTFDLMTPGVTKQTMRTITKILRQRGEEEASIIVPYFEDTDTPEIDFALTVAPDGRVLHLSDAALKNESIYAKLPDYRRLARWRFACKEPRAGSVLDVQFTVVGKRDPALEPFCVDEAFLDDTPILRKEVVVIAPEGACQWRTFGLDKNNADLLAFSQKPVQGGVEYAWKLTQPQPGVIPEPLMPPMKSFAPGVTVAAVATWEDVVRTYAAALDKVPPLPDALQQKAKELAAKGGAEAVYNFVARGIRTVPVPPWQYHIVPHAPEDTARRGIANELDKNFLYAKLLEAAGIPCTFALVRDRSHGPMTEDLPSLRAFNRAAVYLVQEKRFSNVSSDLLTFDTLAGDLQEAPALLIAAPGGPPVSTQKASPEQEENSTRFEGAIDAGGGLELTVTYAARGNSAASMRAMKDLDKQQLRNVLQQQAGRLHPATVLKDFRTSDLADLTVPPEVTLVLSIARYATRAGDDLLLFNLPAIAYQAGDVGRPTREHALFWPHLGRECATGVLKLPADFKVYSLPKNMKFNSSVAAYSAKLKKRRDTVLFTDAFDLKALHAPADAYPEYKHCKERRADLSRQRVILTRKK